MSEQADHDVDDHLAAPVGRPSDHSMATSSAPEVEDCEDLEVVEVRSDESGTNVVGMSWNGTTPMSIDPAAGGESFTQVEGLEETSGRYGSHGDKENDSVDKDSSDEEIQDADDTADKPAGGASHETSTRTGLELSRDRFRSRGNNDNHDDDDNDNDDDGSDKDGRLDTAGNRTLAASHQSAKLSRTGSAANGLGFGSSENSADRDDDGPLDTAGKPTPAASHQTSIQTGESGEIAGLFGRPQNHAAAAAADTDFDDDDDGDDGELAGIIAKPSFSPFSVISASAGGDHHHSIVANDNKNFMENKTSLCQDNENMNPDHDIRPVSAAPVTAVAAESNKSPIAKDLSFYGASSDDDEKASDEDDDDDDDDDKGDNKSGDGVYEKNRVATISRPGASNSFDDVFAQNRRDSPPQPMSQGDRAAIEEGTGGDNNESNSGVDLDEAKEMEGRVTACSDSEEEIVMLDDKNAGGDDRNEVNRLSNSPSKTQQPASWEETGKDAKREVRTLFA